MDTKQLQTHLQQQYDRDTWRRVLESVFASVYFLNTPAPISVPNSQIAECHQTGVVRLHDGKNIALFEARLDDGVHLLRNRVGVRNLMTRFIDEAQTHGVLVVYDQGKANYRLTFVARESGITPQGEWVAFETASKRFTYVLGEGETCRTAAERLALLAAKKAAAGLSDVIDAFSVERLSKEFFTRYKTHYQAFVEYLTASNFRQSAFCGDDKAIRDFVKKLLGRIVFLHFLQKKGWLGATDNAYANGDRQFMQHFWDASGKRDTFYAEHLRRLFFDALNNNRREQDAFAMPDGAVVKIPYLNGGLFDKDQIEERTEYLTVPSALFDNLFAFFGEYNFTIDENDPEEREVGIDPEMLGHIFENLLEDNKDKGAFYTPKEIVQYMTQESLIEYLYAGLTQQPTPNTSQEAGLLRSLQNPTPTLPEGEGVSPLLRRGAGGEVIDGGGLRKPLEYFIRYKLKGDELPEAEQGNAAQFFRAQIAFMQRYGAALDRLLDAVKICDPAIGSGAFPMGLLNEIYHCKLLLNNTYTPADRAAIKRRIIEHSIYGVDIEKGAVDIARLRFWLALIVEEATPTPLPNLDYKIVVGDSLISKFQDHVIEIKWDAQSGDAGQFGLLGSKADERKRDLLKRVTERQSAFFHADAAAKPALAQDIRALKIDLLIAQLDAMIAQDGEQHAPKGTGKANQKKLERYLQTEGWKQAKDALSDLKQHPDKPFEHFDWKLDFPEILNPALIENEPGFDIVIGNPPYGAQFDNIAKTYIKQQYRSHKYKYESYIYFIEKGLVLSKNKGILCYITPQSWLTLENDQTIREIIAKEANLLKVKIYGENIFEEAIVNTVTFLLQNSIHNANLEIAFKDENWKITKKEWLSLPLYKIEYKINPQYRCIISKILEVSMPLEKFGEVIQGITPYDSYQGHSKEIIQSRAFHFPHKKDESCGKWLEGKDVTRYDITWGGEWLSYGEWLAAPREKKYFEGRRILFREIPGKNKRIQASLVEDVFYHGHSISPFKPYNEYEDMLFFILGIVNSTLISWFANLKLPNFGKDIYPKLNPSDIKQLPIYKIENNDISNIVSRILANKKNRQNSNDLENILDIMVYKLYGLTYDEARTVDPALAISRADYNALPVGHSVL